VPFVTDPAEARFVSNEWRAALEGFLVHIEPWKWINHHYANAAALNKLEQLTRANRFGLLVPPTLVTQSGQEARAFERSAPFGIVAKPLASGYLQRENGVDTSIYTNLVAHKDLGDDAAIRSCPTLFQHRVRKAFDVRVTVVDEHVVPVAMTKLIEGEQIVDIRRDNMQGVHYEKKQMPREVERVLLSLLKSYQLRFAAVDFVVEEKGEWYFLEINPNGQWAWLDSSASAGIGVAFVEATASVNSR